MTLTLSEWCDVIITQHDYNAVVGSQSTFQRQTCVLQLCVHLIYFTDND